MTSPDRTDDAESRSNAWHQSTLENLLDGCSWQYYLTYVARVQGGEKKSASAGTAYHAAIEEHEKARMTGGESEAGLPMQEMVAIAEAAAYESSDDPEVAAAAAAAVRNWYTEPMRDGGLSHRDWLLQYRPIAVEPYFNVPLVEGARPIGGWIDAIYEDPRTSEVFVVDHKTAKSLSRWGHDGADHRKQATMYATALVLSDDFPQVVDLPRMVYMVSRTSIGKSKQFEPARRVEVQPDLHDVAQLGDRIRQAEVVLERGAFARAPEWVLCDARWCPFFEGCMVTGELSPSGLLLGPTVLSD
jgi:hypothetical protein